MYPTKQETQQDAAILLSTIVISIVIGVGIALYRKEYDVWWMEAIFLLVFVFIGIWFVLGLLVLAKTAFGV